MKNFISCDWGTSSFRLRLIETDTRQVLAESRSAQGIATAYALCREAGGKRVALSWGRIEYLNDRENKLTAVTSVEIARFTTAPEYDPKDWKRMSSTPWMSELATYYTCDPFWKTARFAPATKATAKRP